MSRIPLYLVATMVFLSCFLISYAALSESPPPVIRPFRHIESPLIRGTPPEPYKEPAPGPMCDDPNDGIEPIAPDDLGLLLEGGPTGDEARTVERAIDGCTQTSRKVADPWMVLALLRIEEDMGLPTGILAAIWCREASMRTVKPDGSPIRGDWHDGVAHSMGPMQSQKWLRDFCGANIETMDKLIFAARCVASYALSILPKAEKLCHARAWAMAEAMAMNGPRYQWGKGRRDPCSVKSEHWLILESWEYTE